MYVWKVLAVLLLPSSLLLLTSVRVAQWQVGYEIGRLEAQVKIMSDKDRELSTEIATLKRPQRLTQIAQERLGLHRAKASQYLRIYEKHPL